jgi:hypothetical protein
MLAIQSALVCDTQSVVSETCRMGCADGEEDRSRSRVGGRSSVKEGASCDSAGKNSAEQLILNNDRSRNNIAGTPCVDMLDYRSFVGSFYAPKNALSRTISSGAKDQKVRKEGDPK